MKLTSLLRFLGLVLAISSLAPAQSKAAPTIAFGITGTLVSSENGAPVPHGHLSATLVPQDRRATRRLPAPTGTFDADENGRFSIPLPSAGMWRVAASARGYVTQAYEEHESFSSGVVLTNDSPEMHLRFRISPEAVITGTVLDEAGEPVRNARLTLLALHALGPDSIQLPARTRASVVTDDRGYYEFDGLLPGDYRISVQAQVWYATAAQQRRLNPSDQTPLDPSLDVAYPLTWYPGTSDPAEAETLSLGQGDSRQANFQLLPVPSVHLHIQPDTSAMTTGRRIQSYPMIERISAGGGGYIPLTSVHIDPQGAIDVGGLSPGRYEVRMQGPGQQMKPALVDVTAGSSQTLDMSTASAMANVTIHINEASDAGANSVQVSLIDPETGRNAARDSSGAYLLSGALLRQRRTTVADHTVVVPPGRYEVVLNGRPELYLTGMSAQSAEVTGRFVTVTSGNSTLDLHVANGRASVTGIAAMQGKPSVGAMVLLVPATLGNPDGLNTIRRDQTNTDGSFDLKDVLPGQYILLAIDRGWQVNWKDPSTLHGYMMHGVPVVLTPEASLKENIETQAP